jgi:fatty acyl-CoA reductase
MNSQLTDLPFSSSCLADQSFDDMNLERLRLTMAAASPEEDLFNFDPKTIDWKEYFYKIHIPGILKYVLK